LSPERLGVTIAQLRKKKKLTQAQLAERVGVHRIYIAQIEGATKVPSLATLEKIAEALGVKARRLLK
jgi:transcriptional regulator with XRE-family HTH domain